MTACYTKDMVRSTKAVPTFFWYDLETSGTDPRRDRIMQFAGQRTTLALEPVGEPVNVLIRLAPDVLPQPDAIMITGITPQMTLTDGITEVEFLKLFTESIALPGTIFVGYNSVRFDDEFMRFLHWRNFYDAYSWQWRDGRGKWDLLDVVRMTRALRPEGIAWPMDKGKATNRLELITKANAIDHESAHDALSDVRACIAVAKLINEKQPKLFSYLLSMREKQNVRELVERGEPFVYTSGKYDGAYEKTTVVTRIAANPNAQGSLVYDLRHDPTPFFALSPAELAARWKWTRDENAPARLPIKTIQYNRCPAVAPLAVLDRDSQGRLGLDPQVLAIHREKLRENNHFITDVLEALTLLEQERAQQGSLYGDPDTGLYDNFVGDDDSKIMSVVRAAAPSELSELTQDFKDERLRQLLPLYKARNFANELSETEREAWDKHCYDALMAGGTKSRLAQFMHRLADLAATETRADKRYILEELQLYAESIMPVMDI